MIYVVLPGETLLAIARKFNTSLQILISYNPQISNPNFIIPGQIINLPPGEYSDKLCPLLKQGDRGPNVRRIQILLKYVGFYTGTIDGIFGPLTQTALLAWQRNIKEIDVTGVVDSETWVSLGFECGVRPDIAQYMVRPGGSLFIIATWFGVTIERLLQINPQKL